MEDQVNACACCKTRPRIYKSYCLECKRQLEKDLRNRDLERDRQRKTNERISRRDKARDFINKIKSSTPCKDCEKTYPYYIMHFDHLDPKAKKHEISSLANGMSSWKLLIEEVSKCQVVCANCHAERTHQRGYLGFVRAVPNPIKSRSRAIKIMDQNGNTYKSQRDAALKLSLKQSKISLVLRGKRKSHRGFRFSYVEIPKETV